MVVQVCVVLAKPNNEGLPDPVASKPLSPVAEPEICVPIPGFGFKLVLTSGLLTPSCQLALILLVVVTAELKNRNARRAGIKRSVVTVPLPVMVPLNVSNCAVLASEVLTKTIAPLFSISP